MSVLTLLEIANRNLDPSIGIIEKGVKYNPEMQVVPAQIIQDTSYWQTIRKTRPSGAYRNINAGTTWSSSEYESKLIAMKLHTIIMRYDKALEVTDKRGDLEASEMAGAYISALEAHCKSFWYGDHATLGTTGAFPGLYDLADAGLVYDATGTTPNTGSSAWLLCFGENQIKHIFGFNSPFTFDPWMDSYMVDPNAATKGILYRASNMNVYSGVAAGDKNAFGRIKNLTAEANKGLTFAKMEALKALFPTGSIPMGNVGGTVPCAWFVSKRSYQQLQASLTATSPTGMPAPYPKADNDGIPIYVTDSLVSTEPIV